VDTGSNISLIQPGVCSSEVRATSISRFGVTCDKLEMKGVQDVQVNLSDRNYLYKFLFFLYSNRRDGNIGMDFFFRKLNTKLELEKEELSL